MLSTSNAYIFNGSVVRMIHSWLFLMRLQQDQAEELQRRFFPSDFPQPESWLWFLKSLILSTKKKYWVRKAIYNTSGNITFVNFKLPISLPERKKKECSPVLKLSFCCVTMSSHVMNPGLLSLWLLWPWACFHFLVLKTAQMFAVKSWPSWFSTPCHFSFFP